MTVKKYQRKPVQVEAALVTKADLKAIAKWSKAPIKAVRGMIGEYIIKDEKGEFASYPAEEFNAKYEPIACQRQARSSRFL